MKQLFRVNDKVFIQSSNIEYDEKYDQYEEKKQKLYFHTIMKICTASLYFDSINYAGTNSSNIAELKSYIKSNNITELYPIDDSNNNLLIKVSFDIRRGTQVLQSKVTYIRASIVPKHAITMDVDNNQNVINFNTISGTLRLPVSELYTMLRTTDVADNIALTELDIFIRDKNSKITVNKPSSQGVVYNTTSSIVKEVSDEMLHVTTLNLIDEELNILPDITDIVLDINIDISGDNTVVVSNPDILFIDDIILGD